MDARLRGHDAGKGRCRLHEVFQRLFQPRLCHRIGRFRRLRLIEPCRRHERDLVFDLIENRQQGRAHQQGFRHIDAGRLSIRQFFHIPHHVVAEIAEQTSGHRLRLIGIVDPAFGQQRAQILKRRARGGREFFALSAPRG